MFFKKRAEPSDASPAVPKPYVLTPDGGFSGNDGNWSTFTFNIGANDQGQGQNFKMLISTSSPSVLVPGQADWCNSDCASERGVQLFNGRQPSGFDSQASSNWKQLGLNSLPDNGWWSGDSLQGTWGTDTVGLGESSPESLVLGRQYVVEYTFQEYFLGSFGLAVGPVATAGESRYPFLRNFVEPANLSSLSYGYTAGAYYRNNNGVQANLVLGGYDAARVDMDKGVSIHMPNRQDNTLAVGVQSIIYSPDQDVEANRFSFTTGDNEPFSARIDSTLPYLWLPKSICDEFEFRYQLEYDDDLNLYTVNSSAHQHNVQQNSTLAIKIGASVRESDEWATIELPYAAFDLSIDYPTVNESTRYFPIKRSSNGKHVLGRAFLQEAYIVVDYERLNFTVAPARFTQPMAEQELVSIYNETYNPPGTTPTPIPGDGSGDGLSPGTVAGIVVGVVVGLLLVALGAFFWWRKRRLNQKSPYSDKVQEIDTVVAGTQVKQRRVSELDSEPPGSPKPPTLGGFYGDRDKDGSPFPPISEMESPPAELYSPGLSSSHSDGHPAADYFKVTGHGATRGLSEKDTPVLGTPLAELPADESRGQLGGLFMGDSKGSPTHSRGPSDTSLQTNIDEVMARPEVTSERRAEVQSDANNTSEEGHGQAGGAIRENREGEGEGVERRPSHTRGLSDTTVNSDSTAVSQPTPEEREQWALGTRSPHRPLSE